MDLNHKHVVLTGGVSGIGRSLLETLITEDAMVGVIDKDSLGLKALRESHQNVHCIDCDVTDNKQVEAAVDALFLEFGSIDILVNNAGLLYSAPLVSLSPEGIKKHDIGMWQKTISTDLSSVFYVTVHVVEKMIMKRTKGVIVNISSVSAAGNAGQSAYSAAKAGVNALTSTWAKELGLLGIRVAGVAPGYTETVSTRQVMCDDALREVIQKVPLRRLGKTEEIAGAIISVIKNDFISGKTLEVDGGLVI